MPTAKTQKAKVKPVDVKVDMKKANKKIDAALSKAQAQQKTELTQAEQEARRTRLKTLIMLGKERGYLTYAEVNDHLPDEMLDAEQIEGIISMINDMGIQVYDEAPDAEALLMNESTAQVADEDVDRKSTRLNSSHNSESRMPSSA
jgi:RNA polymerase primary sigma factor